MKETNRCVFTWGPCTGKTTLLEALSHDWYKIYPEAARVIIDTWIADGSTIEEIRADEMIFQQKALDLKIQREKEIDEHTQIFFDRWIPDSIAYYRLNNATQSEIDSIPEIATYKHVYVLDPLPYKKDDGRIEDEALAIHIHQNLILAYEELWYKVIIVPVFHDDKETNIRKRIEFVVGTL